MAKSTCRDHAVRSEEQIIDLVNQIGAKLRDLPKRAE